MRTQLLQLMRSCDKNDCKNTFSLTTVSHYSLNKSNCIHHYDKYIQKTCWNRFSKKKIFLFQLNLTTVFLNKLHFTRKHVSLINLLIFPLFLYWKVQCRTWWTAQSWTAQSWTCNRRTLAITIWTHNPSVAHPDDQSMVC